MTEQATTTATITTIAGAIRIPTPRAAIPDTRDLDAPPILFGSRHCTHPSCTRQDTATADGVCGRRCAQHPPAFDPAHAVECCRRLGIRAALAYIGAYTRMEQP